MITTMALANIIIKSHLFISYLWWEHLKCTLSSFQVYNIVLLTIFTMLCIRSLEHIHFLPGKFYPFAPPPPFLAPGYHHSIICFYKFGFFRFHIKKWLQYRIFLSLSVLLPSSMPAMLSQMAELPSFSWLNNIHIYNIFIHSFVDEHLGCLHILVLGEKMGVEIWLWDTFISFV